MILQKEVFCGIAQKGKTEEEAEAVKNAFLAKESYLKEAFSAIDEQYQDMDNYLKKGLGISEELICAFREKVKNKGINS